MVSIKNGIGYSDTAQARFIDMSAVLTTEDRLENPITPAIPDDKIGAQPWSPWGANNLLPMEMAADIEATGILNAIIDGKARFAICNGIVPVITAKNKETGKMEIKEYVDDTEVLDFLDRNNTFFHLDGWVKDLMGMGQCVARYGLNKKKGGQKIITFERTDVTEFRYEKQNAKGLIDNLYISAEWNKVTGIGDKRVFPVPNLNPHNPYADLEKKAAGGAGYQFALTCRYPGWNRHYYSMPLWYAAHKWVKIAQGVPEMKAAIFENSMHVKYVVIIYEKYWDKAFAPEWAKYTDEQKTKKRQEVYDDIEEFLVGNKNAGKSIFTTGYRDSKGMMISDIEIKPVEDNMKDGKLLPDSAAANTEIAFAMHYNNTILGGNQASGPYDKSSGGSNVRESILMQVVLHELERQYVRRIMMVPAYFNGWKRRLPGLDFIIPAEILTTLDTGGSSKPVITGPTKDNADGTN